MDPKDALLLKLKEELEDLEKKLTQKDELDAQMGVSADVIAKMEADLAKQREELAKASSQEKEEKDRIMQKIEQNRKEIEKQKKQQELFQNKLKELTGVLSTYSKSQLIAKTNQNESAIREAKEKLRIREERSRKLQQEMEERQRKREQFEAQVASLQKSVGDIQAEYKQCIEEYQNLKVMEPEIQKTIQADREELANNIDSLSSELDFYTQIVDNFIPAEEINRIKGSASYNDEKEKWEIHFNKKILLQQVLSMKRPKSAIGAPIPCASSTGKYKGNATNDDAFICKLEPLPVLSESKKGPIQIDLRQVNINSIVDSASNETQCDVCINL